MILSRAAAHLKSLHWTGFFIEIVIVVVGVFIGIQASNWNSDRENKKKGLELAARLRHDLEADLEGREHMVTYYVAVKDSAEKTDTLLVSSSPDPRALVVNAYRASEFSYFGTTRAAWDEVVSSGELGILPQGIDLAAVSTYYAYDSSKDTKDTIQNSPYRMQVRRIIPYAMQKAIRAGCSDDLDEIGLVRGFKAECRLDVSDAQIAAAANALKQAPDLAPDLRLHFSAINSAIDNMSGDVFLLKKTIASFDGNAAATPAAKP
ncbi:MAG TPA: DUF6090 family protein [Rhodanobacteraceae bacterium]|nr:DUF6090 family protein [Rhodanobacteraceae bacterium]